MTGNRLMNLAPYAEARVVVLGSTGFLGRWVARALSQVGAQVVHVVRDPVAAERVFPEYDIHGAAVVADAGDDASLTRVIRQVKPTITFNLIGYGVDRTERESESAFRVNAGLVTTLCENLARICDGDWPGQHLVHVGSGAEAADETPRAAHHAPASTYSRSKAAGTRALTHGCWVHGLNGVTARLFNVYGPGEHAGRLLPSLFEAARTGSPVRLTAGTQARDFTYVEDVAEGLLRLGLAPCRPGETIPLTTGRLTTVRQFAEIAAAALGLPPDRLLFGALPERADEVPQVETAPDRLRQLTGWAPRVGVLEGVLRTAAFYTSPDAHALATRPRPSFHEDEQ